MFFRAYTLFFGILLVLPAFGVDLDSPPIEYRSKTPNDRFAQLKSRIESGDFQLATTGREALGQILRELEVPAESQVLVFSKTSAQNSRISPDRPRCIFFSDNCYVGWVQGGSIEILTYDPDLGAVFYLVDPTQPRPAGPKIDRPASCLNCHERSSTGGVPGGLVRSVYAQKSGMPLFHAGSFYVGDDTEIANRWGGWYVTGSSGDQRHMGNAFATDEADSVSLSPLTESRAALEKLDAVIDTRNYPAGGTSDIVALMVLEHQVGMHNALSAANLGTRQLIHRTNAMRRSMGEPKLPRPEGTVKRVIESQSAKIVARLLFRNEHEMSDDGVEGGEAFQAAFAKNRLESADGRSLKDFRLYERLFKHRCSYVIYSEVFDHLTPWLKAEIYRQLAAALTSSSDPLSSHLSATERERILTILRETKPEFR